MQIKFETNINWKWLFIEIGVWLAIYQCLVSLVSPVWLPTAMFAFGAATVYHDMKFSRINKE